MLTAKTSSRSPDGTAVPSGMAVCDWTPTARRSTEPALIEPPRRPHAKTSAVPARIPLLASVTDPTSWFVLTSLVRVTVAGAEIRESARGTTRKGTRRATRPAAFVVGVATTAPRIEVRPATVSVGASTDGNVATAAAVRLSLTDTETVRPAATVTVEGVIATCAPSDEPAKFALRP